MCSDVLNKPILVLNKSWLAVSIMRTKDSFCKVFSGMAKVIDENYVQYNWDEWVEVSQKTEEGDNASFVHTPNYKVKVPSIVRLLYYNRLPKTDVKLTRRNILVRDKFICQYCGKKINMKTATLDHVVPKSKKGKTSWTNLVACCAGCNVQKANRTPEEAKMRLRKIPKKPGWSPVYSKFVSEMSPTWLKFVKDQCHEQEEKDQKDLNSDDELI